MNKTMASIDVLLKPGHPLMVVGPRGCGKAHAVSKVVDSRGMTLRSYSPWAMSILFEHELIRNAVSNRFHSSMPEWFFKQHIRNLPGNVAVYIDDLHRLKNEDEPQFLMMLLEQILLNPDRCFIIGGLTPHPFGPLTDRCNVVTFI